MKTLAPLAAIAAAFAIPCSAATAPADLLAQATIPITQARATTGSRIRRELPKLTIPATDPYDKLTPEQRRAFGAQGLQFVEREYRWQTVLPRVEGLLRSLPTARESAAASPPV